MALLDRFQNMFRGKTDAEVDKPDVQPTFVPDSMLFEKTASKPEVSPLPEPALDIQVDGEEESEAGQVHLPFLGNKTVTQHQRTLTTLLVFALVVLGAVTFFALSQTEKIDRKSVV